MSHAVEVYEKYGNEKAEIRISVIEAPNWEARMASCLIERWGLVVAEPDGEDSAGRAKVRHMRPEAIVQHACDTAALAVAEFRKRGWTFAVPTQAEANEILAQRQNSEETKK